MGANLDRKSKFYIPDVVAYPRLDLYVFSVSTYTHDVTPRNRKKLLLNGQNMSRSASGRPNEKKAYPLLLGFPLTFPKHPTTDVVV